MVLIFSNSNKTQVYKMPCRKGPHHETEILMNPNYLNLLKPNEHPEDFYNRRLNDKKLLLEIEHEKYIHAGEKIVSFETTYTIVEYSSIDAFNDVKYPYAHGIENI